MILLSFLSHSDRSCSTFSICAGFGGLPNRPRLKLTVAHTVSNASVVQFLRHQADHASARRGSRVTMSWPSTVTRAGRSA